MKTPVSVKEGHPNNWPRKIARKHLFAIDAVLDLRGNMDESNEKFALIEFTEEREAIVRKRIREELLEAITENAYLSPPDPRIGRTEQESVMDEAAVRAALDRVCPEAQR